MSKLIDKNISIYDALQNIETEKYVMPAFQRQYVWNMAQIEKLWDSILLDYPIATFLFWHLDEDNTDWQTYFCKFLKAVTFNNAKLADDINYELSSINCNISDTAVLDGQQRLTSLYLSLYGTAYVREKHARKKTSCKTLHYLVIELNKRATIEDEYNRKKYDIKFTSKIQPTQFKISNLMNSEYKNISTRQERIENAVRNIPQESQEYAKKILNKLCEKIYDEKLVHYTEIQGMQQDDALEMFVRFNSGGRTLKPPEITMSILDAYWPSARREVGKLLTDSFENFGTDFIIRTALMLFGKVDKTIINKEIAENLKNNWEHLKKAFRNLQKFLDENKIDIARFSGVWNVLIPLVYAIYYNHSWQENNDSMMKYLVRAVLFRYFQSGTKAKLLKLRNKIKEYDYSITTEMLDSIYELRVTDSKIEDILNSKKGDKISSAALYYLSHNWMSKDIKYEVDHLHPDNRFSDDNRKPLAITMQEWKDWKGCRDRLPNLHLLEGRSNASKSDISLNDYVNDMTQEQKQLFYEHSFVRPSISLEFDNFGRFYKERKDALAKKIRELVG